MDGYADSRDYYATVFEAEIQDGLKGIWGVVRDAQEGKSILSSSDCEIQHGYIFSTQRFANPDRVIIDEQRSTDTTPVYRYDIYTLRSTTEFGVLYVLAFPFRRLGRHITQEIVDGGVTRGITFCSVDLKKLVAAVIANRHSRGAIRIVGYDVQVTSDPQLTELVFRGEDPVHSPIFNILREQLPPKALIPRTCVLVHDDSQTPRIRLHCDRFGNYKFYLKRRAENLATFHTALVYLQKEDLVRRTNTSPFTRTLIDEGENDFE